MEKLIRILKTKFKGLKEVSNFPDSKAKKVYLIKLGEENLSGKKWDKIPLSTGEQNFLSLTMEFLKARKLKSKIIVLDDPISSFDSIYKNKIAYSIVNC